MSFPSHTVDKEPQAAPARHSSSDIRLRAFVIAVAIIVIDQYWVIMMEKVKSGPYPTTASLLANAVFILFTLVAANKFIQRISPRQALTNAELLLIYTMVAVAAVLAGHDMLPTLVGCMTYPWRFATPENGWAQTFIPSLPASMSVTDPDAIKGLWEGNSSLYITGFWKLWLMPVLKWLPFVVGLVWVMACISTLLRKQWIHRERLTYPIVHLPLAMTDPDGAIWRSGKFWTGFGLSFGTVLYNGFATYLPTLPIIPVDHNHLDLAGNITTKPWNGLGWTPLSFYPFVIGIGYLLPTDLVFSCWFFYWFWKLQKVAAVMFGFDVDPDFPYTNHQTIGGVFAIVAMMVWSSRGYLRQVWQRVKGEKSELDDKDEPMSYRVALIGGLVGVAFLAWFMGRIGMSPLIAVVVFAIYFVIAIAIGKIRAELGAPIHDFGMMGPDFLVTKSAGIGGMGNGDLVGLSYLYWFNRAYRAHPMPIVAEGYKMADSCSARQRKFLWGILIAVTVGTIATFWAYLHVGYRLGFSVGVSQGGAYAWGATSKLSSWWSRPEHLTHPNWAANGAFGLGFLFCALLSFMRLKVLGWPFHPIGYVVSSSWQINIVWCPLLIAWLVKTQILKYGGLSQYRAFLPFFLGLILGEMTMGCIWSIVGIVFDIPYYSFWGS